MMDHCRIAGAFCDARLFVAWCCVAICAIRLLAGGTAFAQQSDVDALRQRVGALEWRPQQYDAANAQIAQLQAQVGMLTAELQEYRNPPPLSPAATGILEPVILAAAAEPSGGLVTEPEPVPAGQPNFTAIPSPAVAEPQSAGYGSGYGTGYGSGLQFGFWGWLSYEAEPKEHLDTFWAWETQLNVTKSFTDRIAASADLDFIDTNNGAYVIVDQLFLSILYPDLNDSILTAGKFNPPFGIEAHEFWYRQTGSTSLLFYAQPQDLVGIMYSQPIPCANLTVRGFVVNGFDDNLDVNQQPSLGLTVEYQPCKCLNLAATNYWGPEFPNDNDDKLFFTEEQAVWHVTPKLCVSAEFLYGMTQSPSGIQSWSGYAIIASQTLSDKWRLFAQWSELDDREGYITGEAQNAHEVNAGFAYYLDRHVEARVEYRHGNPSYGSDVDDSVADEVSADLTFGY